MSSQLIISLEDERKALILQRDNAATTNKERISIRGKIAALNNRLAALTQAQGTNFPTGTTTATAALWVSILAVVLHLFGFMSTSILSVKKLQYMGSDRIAVLERISYPVTVCGGTATAFAVSAFGRQLSVTVAHFPCNGTSPSHLVHCDGLDISLSLECPPAEVEYALDASIYTDPLTGQDAFVYGFGREYFVKNYDRATIGGRLEIFENTTAFNNTMVIQPSYRYLLGAEQRLGFSAGSCVLNGYGVIGVACGFITNTTRAVIVPWADVYQCIEKKVQEGVQFPTTCNLTTIAPPTLDNFVERNIINKSTYLRSLSTWLYNNL